MPARAETSSGAKKWPATSSGAWRFSVFSASTPSAALRVTAMATRPCVCVTLKDSAMSRAGALSAVGLPYLFSVNVQSRGATGT